MQCPNCKSKNMTQVTTENTKDNMFSLLSISQDNKKIHQDELLAVKAYCCNDCLLISLFGVNDKNQNQK